ncbi:MAG: LacI family DNA-binding transcriptional regulator, partial [Lachnospiraceae bacterium]|nr:LacI family DNA-binding transcriptional regulator [Lachnospiraceae bacterium]
MDESVSIRKIAELAGVSVATVSRIINKKGRYSKET